MLKTAKEFIEKFPDLAIDNFGKQSDTEMTNQTLHLRLDRQKIIPKYDTYWGNYQIQINSQLMTKNKKNPKTSLAAVLFETGYTYPKDVVKTAFQISLEKNRQVYVYVSVITVNLECDEGFVYTLYFFFHFLYINLNFPIQKYFPLLKFKNKQRL